MFQEDWMSIFKLKKESKIIATKVIFYDLDTQEWKSLSLGY